MKDLAVVRALDAAQVRYCLIGAHALSVWGFTRNTLDIDFLTLEERILARRFWPDACSERLLSLRRGDDDDPIAGLARFKDPPIDVIVGRGALVRETIATASVEETTGVAVARPLHLALLKLDAGGMQDLVDVHRLIIQRTHAMPDDDLFAQIEARATSLSDWGQQAWARLKSMAADEAARPRSLRSADD